MEFVFRAMAIYFFLMIIFSMAGKRAISEMDTFDLILLLIISETTQNALVGQNFSVTSAFILIATLVGLEVLMSWIKHKKPKVENFLQGGPLVLVDHGQMLKQRANKVMVDEADILNSAREKQGLERMDQIKYAILEMSGDISIIPKESEA
jgi:uncharacterized membrane protein YcaP (DUF421 family)